MQDTRTMTPEEIISEWKKMLPTIDPKSFKDMGLGQIMTADLINATFIQYYEDFLRTSLRALLLHVKEEIEGYERKQLELYGGKLPFATFPGTPDAQQNAIYHQAIDDCISIILSKAKELE